MGKRLATFRKYLAALRGNPSVQIGFIGTVATLDTVPITIASVYAPTWAWWQFALVPIIVIVPSFVLVWFVLYRTRRPTLAAVGSEMGRAIFLDAVGSRSSGTCFHPAVDDISQIALAAAAVRNLDYGLDHLKDLVYTTICELFAEHTYSLEKLCRRLESVIRLMSRAHGLSVALSSDFVSKSDLMVEPTKSPSWLLERANSLSLTVVWDFVNVLLNRPQGISWAAEHPAYGSDVMNALSRAANTLAELLEPERCPETLERVSTKLRDLRDRWNDNVDHVWLSDEMCRPQNASCR